MIYLFKIYFSIIYSKNFLKTWIFFKKMKNFFEGEKNGLLAGKLQCFLLE